MTSFSGVSSLNLANHQRPFRDRALEEPKCNVPRAPSLRQTVCRKQNIASCRPLSCTRVHFAFGAHLLPLVFGRQFAVLLSGGVAVILGARDIPAALPAGASLLTP